ncbi:MAG: hypothetical protein JST44_08305, partial [Cyanobacteria bacterium SZAS LIN-5]|nr:hypothetical protein [Cyanobacteria bacterium SZAS LIN-5]
KTGTVNSRLESVSPDQPSSVKGKESVKTRKNPDGGHTDTSTGPNGSTETATYDKNGKLVLKRTDNRDGTYTEWKVDKAGHTTTTEKGSDGAVHVRDDYPNGSFKDETKYKDGTKSHTSHYDDGKGGYIDNKINRDGSETLSHVDQDGRTVFNFVRSKDGSYSQRAINTADGSITTHEQKADGSYVETRNDSSGTSRIIHTVNTKDGSSETKSYDSNGKLVKERQENKDHSFKETSYDADGNKTVHEQNAKGEYTEQSFNGKGEAVSPLMYVNNNVSPEFVQKVKDELARLQQAVRELLIHNNAAIAVTGKISDIDPAMAKQKPRGGEKGDTYDDLYGLEAQLKKNGKNSEIAIIAEGTRSGPNDDVEGTVRHEVGHAVDHLLKFYSHSADFKNAYDQDVAKMSREIKEQEKYFLQKGHHGIDGREEAFAEVVRAVTGDPSETRNAEVLKLYPKLAEIVRKRLSQLPQ